MVELLKTLLHFLYRCILTINRIVAFFQQTHHLHSARWALEHELKSLISPILDGQHLLLGEASFHHVYRVAPTKQKPELGHLLISGRTRCGKGLHIESQLLSWDSSAIVNDIKGELYRRTAGGREKEFGSKIIVFDPKGNGHKYDPLEGLYSESDLQTAATTLLDRPHEGQNQIFTDSAITMLTQIFLAARLEEKRTGERPLPFAYRIMNKGLPGAATILEIISQQHHVEPNLATVFLDVDFQNADFKDKFLRSCWGTLTKRMRRILTKESVRSFTGSDFTAKDLLTSNVTLFLKWPEKDLVALQPMVHLIWTSLLDGMINYYDDVEGKGCHELLAVLDEFGRTGLPNLPHYAATCAGRKMSLLVVVQNPAQFEANYGVYQAKVLRSQMEYQIIYRPADYDTAEEYQKWLGFKSGFATSYTKRGEQDVSEGLSEREVPLITTDELMLLGDEETICYRSGMRKFRARRVDIRRFPILKQRQAIPPPPLSVPTQSNSRALTTVWEEKYPVSFVDPDERYMKN